MDEFRKKVKDDAEMWQAMGSMPDSFDRSIDGIDRQIRKCYEYFIDTFKADNKTLGEPSCEVIESSILGRSDADSADYEALIDKLEREELSQLETVDLFFYLISLYIERGRLRRLLVEQVETSKTEAVTASGGNSTGKKSGYSWEKEDHYVMTSLGENGRRTLARLLPHQGHEEDKKTEN